jgi:three-Cys-motif partner protein
MARSDDKAHVTPAPDDDGVCPEVGGWTEEKHRLVSYYSTLFSSAMKDKWDTLVYLDLYAGAGCSRVRGTQKRILGSPLLALSVKDPFDKYIFCEEDRVKLDALKNRVTRLAPTANVAYISGDCNRRTAEILREIPQGSSNRRVLSLCFTDPFDISLKFKTLQDLSERYIDFLVLLAVWMDAGRAYSRYVLEDAVKVDEFLGSATWRERWKIAQGEAVPFPKFLAKEFAKSMESLGYLPTPLHNMKEVRSDEKNLRLYYIALFSRKEIALKLWDEVLKYSTDQTKFHWE